MFNLKSYNYSVNYLYYYKLLYTYKYYTSDIVKNSTVNIGTSLYAIFH